jgi:hypothetical protein
VSTLRAARSGNNSIHILYPFPAASFLLSFPDVTRRHKLVPDFLCIGITGFFYLSISRTFLPLSQSCCVLFQRRSVDDGQTALASLENPDSGRLRVGGSIGWGIMVLIKVT